MAKVVYTAEATVTGGREQGHGKTTDGALDVQLRPPTEGGGTNPEQLFAVGYAACFEGALGVAARREKAEVGDASIESKVSLITTEDRGFNIAVELDVSLPQVRGRRGGQEDRGGRAPDLPVFERDARQRRGQADRERTAGRLRLQFSGCQALTTHWPGFCSVTVASATCHAGRSPW